MLKQTVVKYIEERLSAGITAVKSVTGGSINSAYCIETINGQYFIKLNDKTLYPGMFEAKANGLDLIATTKTIKVPEVILCENFGDDSLLVLEWIDTQRPNVKASETLGRQLATMHQCTKKYFGLEHNNYMGSLHQHNKKHKDWTSFFIEERVQPMVKMAVDKKQLNQTDVAGFERLYNNLLHLFDEEPPALIHGDLWSGNYLIDVVGSPYVIDPAVSYGHREFDIAMTTLFGGFADEFYAAYNEAFPLPTGWRKRVNLWNLYPLLVHLNLFGAGYLEQVRECLQQYL